MIPHDRRYEKRPAWRRAIGPRTTTTACRTPGKRKYFDLATATAQANEIRERRRAQGRTTTEELRPYKCDSCPFHHVTSSAGDR